MFFHHAPKSTPPQAGTAQPHSEVINAQLDYFFGHTVAKPAPAHTKTPSVSGSGDEAFGLPPPYGAQEKPAPAYSAVAPEPATLAKFLFKYGFFFPPFWLMGTIIMFMGMDKTLTAAELERGKSKEQVEEEVQRLRQVELRWSKRCALAFLFFLTALALILFGLYKARPALFGRA